MFWWRPPPRPFQGSKRPKCEPSGAAETGRMASKTLPHSMPGGDVSISCTWAPWRTSTALLEPQKGSFWPQKAFVGPSGPDLVPTVPDSGPFWDRGQIALFGPPAAANLAPQALLGPPGPPGGPKRARFGPKRRFWGAKETMKSVHYLM